MKKPKPGRNQAPTRRKKTRAAKVTQPQALYEMGREEWLRAIEPEYQEVLKKQAGKCARCGLEANKVPGGRLLIDDEGIEGDDERNISRLVCQKCSEEEADPDEEGVWYDFQPGHGIRFPSQASANAADLRAAMAARTEEAESARRAALDALFPQKPGGDSEPDT